MNAVLSSGIDDRGARPRPVARQNLSKPMKFPDSLGDTSGGYRRSPQMEIIITSRAIIASGPLTRIALRERASENIVRTHFLSKHFANLRPSIRARRKYPLLNGHIRHRNIRVNLTQRHFPPNNNASFAIHVVIASFFHGRISEDPRKFPFTLLRSHTSNFHPSVRRTKCIDRICHL